MNKSLSRINLYSYSSFVRNLAAMGKAGAKKPAASKAGKNNGKATASPAKKASAGAGMEAMIERCTS